MIYTKAKSFSNLLLTLINKQTVLIKATVIVLATLISGSMLVGCEKNASYQGKQDLKLTYSVKDKELALDLAAKDFINTDSIPSSKVIHDLKSKKSQVYLGTLAPLDVAVNKTLIAKDALTVVVNKANPVSNLSLQNLKDIYTGKIKNWHELGGHKEPIVIIDRADISIEKSYFDKFLFGDLIPDDEEGFNLSNDKEILALIEQYPNAIAYVNYSSKFKEDLAVKFVNLEDVAATDKNIYEGYFPIYRPIYLYYFKKLLAQKQLEDELEEIIMCLHENNSSIIKDNKLIPLSLAEIEKIRHDSEPIKIGISAPLDGSYTELGRAVVHGAKLALENKLDRKPLFHERELKLIICNDKANINAAISCANKFVNEKVKAVVGHLNSQLSIETSKIYSNNGIVQISPGTTHPWFTQRQDKQHLIYRTIGKDNEQAELISKIIKKEVKKNSANEAIKVMILYNGTIYGSNLATLIENHIYRNINQQAEVKSCEYSVNERLLHKVCPTLEANYVVFIGEYAEAAQMLVDLALDNKDHIKFIAADGAFHKRFIQLAGLRSEGAYVIGYNTDLKNNSLAELEKQAKKFNADLSSFLVYSYDATKIILDGLDDFLNGDYSSLAEAISKPDHQVASGTISFDQYGDPKQNRFAIYKVEKQKFIKNML